jgi:cytochrome c peroxidase
MKSHPLILLAALCLTATAQEKVIDLTNPANYANQTVPVYITKDNTPVDNEITVLGATLGRVLFYDKRLSRNNTISCSSCHNQATLSPISPLTRSPGKPSS